MKIDEISRELLSSFRESGSYFKYYIPNHADILSSVKRFSGLKSDCFISEFDELDWLRSSLLFSDLVSVYVSSLGKSLVVRYKPPGVEKIHVTGKHEFLTSLLDRDLNIMLGYMLPDGDDLANLLSILEPFLEKGQILVHPTRVAFFSSNGDDSPARGFRVNPYSNITDWEVTSDHGPEDSYPIITNQPERASDNILMEVTIPYIRGVSFSNLAKIIEDEHDYLAALRLALRNTIEKSQEEPHLVSHIVNDVIRPEVDKVNRSLKKVNRMYSLRIAGATIGTAALSLVALTSSDWASALAGLAGATGLGLLFNEYAEYIKLKESEKENPFYLLWKLGLKG